MQLRIIFLIYFNICNGKAVANNIISFIFYLICSYFATGKAVANSCCKEVLKFPITEQLQISYKFCNCECSDCKIY